VIRLAEKVLTLSDILGIKQRMIGTGLIGGKAVGVLLARPFSSAKTRAGRVCWRIHDSFFIGSDVFYTYLVRNGCWWCGEAEGSRNLPGRRRRRGGASCAAISRITSATVLRHAGLLRQSPIIVRSASLLETISETLRRQVRQRVLRQSGAAEKRLEDLLTAVRTIYAST